MRRVKALKLELEGGREEQMTLWKLQMELKKEFGKDLWEKSLERQRGKGTLEDLYWWYQRNGKVKTTQSMIDIQLRKPNTLGLEYLF
jgi:hypothetical protein